MNTTAAQTARTIIVGRVGHGDAVHRVAGDVTACNKSGRPQRIQGLRHVTVEQARALVTCKRCG